MFNIVCVIHDTVTVTVRYLTGLNEGKSLSFSMRGDTMKGEGHP